MKFPRKPHRPQAPGGRVPARASTSPQGAVRLFRSTIHSFRSGSICKNAFVMRQRRTKRESMLRTLSVSPYRLKGCSQYTPVSSRSPNKCNYFRYSNTNIQRCHTCAPLLICHMICPAQTKPKKQGNQMILPPALAPCASSKRSRILIQNHLLRKHSMHQPPSLRHCHNRCYQPATIGGVQDAF